MSLKTEDFLFFPGMDLDEPPDPQEEVDVIHSLIDISTETLLALRTQCASNAEITQQEIRTLETKLIKLFCELLIAKSKLPSDTPPSGAELKQWLKVVGLSESSINAVWQSVSTLELLLNKSNSELRRLIQNGYSNIEEDEMLRWQKSMFNLKRCHHAMIKPGKQTEFTDLSWTKWTEETKRLIQVPPKPVGPEFFLPPITPPYFRNKIGPLIAHRFNKKFLAFSRVTCNYCKKQIFFECIECVECKYSCHKDCESSVPTNCLVPPELLEEFKQTFNSDFLNSQHLPTPDITEAGNVFFFSGSRSDQKRTDTPAKRSQPNKVDSLKDYFNEMASHGDRASGDERLLSKNGQRTFASMILRSRSPSCNSMDTYRSATDSMTDDAQRNEWGVQFDDIVLLEKIGVGRFGTVHRGQWYGDVAVKLLNANYLDDALSLQAFQSEVATFKNTRHENLVLFMGFCMKPQAIITSLCKGNTLYTHIHLRRDHFSLYRASDMAQQVSNGMGYLHAKEIVHKDLTTKNIFLEGHRIIITDFGLFSAAKMQHNNNGFPIPNNWLCYLAPELVRALPIARKFKSPDELQLPFSKASDVYAFGTIWYEMLCCEFPFKDYSPDAIIYQIGIGMKQTLANIQTTREVKDILMISWKFQADDRPDFVHLNKLLEELPKKQMPKTPTRHHLSMSAESVF